MFLWESDDAEIMSAFGHFLARVAVHAPQATVSLAEVPILALARLDPALIAKAPGLQHLSLLYCEHCSIYDAELQEDDDFQTAQAVYTMLFQRHGGRLRYPHVKGSQWHCLLEGIYRLSSVASFPNLESITIWIHPDPAIRYDKLRDLTNRSSLTTVLLEPSVTGDQDTHRDAMKLLLEICENILIDTKNLPKLEKLKVTNPDVRACIEKWGNATKTRHVLPWLESLKRLQDVCHKRKIAFVV